MTKIKSGFLYTIVNSGINSLKYINLVELFKFVVIHLFSDKKNNDKKIMCSQIAVDLFIIFKWLFILVLWIYNISNNWLLIIVWYLLVTNLYTYFYYHTWSSEVLEDAYMDTARVKRRFFNSLLALFYSIYGFAYLYNIPYSNEFSWGLNGHSAQSSLWYSISNSFTASYDVVKSTTDLGHTISIIQLVMMFIFVTIIIGGSIPQINQKKTESNDGL